MHSLQNYGAEEPVYDGNAYAFSSNITPGHSSCTPTTLLRRLRRERREDGQSTTRLSSGHLP